MWNLLLTFSLSADPHNDSWLTTAGSSAAVGSTHQVTVDFGGASDAGKDFHWDIKVSEDSVTKGEDKRRAENLKVVVLGATVWSVATTWFVNGFKHEVSVADLQSSESQSMVWMLKSMVRLALVTSVQWTPPLLPPVRHWGNKGWTSSRGTPNNLPRSQMNSPRCVRPTQMIQESTVPNMARPLRTAWRTSPTLSSSQRSFTALK